MKDFTHPATDPANGRWLCTRAHPMPKDAPAGSRWSHEETEETDDERDFGLGCYCVKMRCKVCGKTWWSELPQ